ncbi:hypothetical protein DYB37_004362 [Aphanomyces astaci]|uniref:Uncharacterized protein n=1 Tax=Aphanomyces astaci TaxID=112090 RepID=A0A397DBP3_APHAT|nr:hypothetical protein DYB36_007596 [Aphanomyces astaci]RHY16144.1 hypothetical protein DYB25_000974 [Aphanomyces astaci]RHY37067.1 hypothetical protein DYB34_012376 [Aphanomyces astaci]RHY62421.1 hypothetical protein DYB38_004516 [Aphanomyces astaci]RHY74232.1 hypothetical protein DYB30_001125 [Aphanomyces astaci]
MYGRLGGNSSGLMADNRGRVPTPVVTTQVDAGSSSSTNRHAWSFVQMNMSLLPIARPLPVHTSPSSLLQKKKALKCKPRTPSNHAADKPASISPRRQGELMPQEPSPPMRTLRELVLRRQDESASSSTSFVPRLLNHRPRCFSDDCGDTNPEGVHLHHDRGYVSDVDMHTSSSLPAMFVVAPIPTPPASEDDDDKALVRVKRILEILDEDRCKEDTMHTPPPRTAKRLRRCDV